MIIRRILRRVLFQVQKLRVGYYYLLSGSVKVVGKPIRNQPLLICGRGTVVFHEPVQIGYFPSAQYFNTYAHFDLRGPGVSIEIGEHTVINNNAVLVADKANITIGKRCLIGTDFTVYTSDFHPLDPQQRLTGEYTGEDVDIMENVFIGSHVTILKGVQVGRNSVIGDGSLVVKDIPENVIAGGVPCRVLKPLS